jgi:hypothetical protein
VDSGQRDSPDGGEAGVVTLHDLLRAEMTFGRQHDTLSEET